MQLLVERAKLLIKELHLLLLAVLEQRRRAAIKAGTPACAVKVEEAQRSVAAWIVLEVEQLGAVPTGSR